MCPQLKMLAMAMDGFYQWLDFKNRVEAYVSHSPHATEGELFG
jgi:hypothetical protein